MLQQGLCTHGRVEPEGRVSATVNLARPPTLSPCTACSADLHSSIVVVELNQTMALFLLLKAQAGCLDRAKQPL